MSAHSALTSLTAAHLGCLGQKYLRFKGSINDFGKFGPVGVLCASVQLFPVWTLNISFRIQSWRQIPMPDRIVAFLLMEPRLNTGRGRSLAQIHSSPQARSIPYSELRLRTPRFLLFDSSFWFFSGLRFRNHEGHGSDCRRSVMPPEQCSDRSVTAAPHSLLPH